MKPYSLPKFVCPGCHAQIDMGFNVLGVSQEIKKGKIVVCGHCSQINKVGDSNLERVSEDELSKYPAQFQAALLRTQGEIRKNLNQ